MSYGFQLYKADGSPIVDQFKSLYVHSRGTAYCQPTNIQTQPASGIIIPIVNGVRPLFFVNSPLNSWWLCETRVNSQGGFQYVYLKGRRGLENGVVEPGFTYSYAFVFPITQISGDPYGLQVFNGVGGNELILDSRQENFYIDTTFNTVAIDNTSDNIFTNIATINTPAVNSYGKRYIEASVTGWVRHDVRSIRNYARFISGNRVQFMQTDDRDNSTESNDHYSRGIAMMGYDNG